MEIGTDSYLEIGTDSQKQLGWTSSLAYVHIMVPRPYFQSCFVESMQFSIELHKLHHLDSEQVIIDANNYEISKITTKRFEVEKTPNMDILGIGTHSHLGIGRSRYRLPTLLRWHLLCWENESNSDTTAKRYRMRDFRPPTSINGRVGHIFKNFLSSNSSVSYILIFLNSKCWRCTESQKLLPPSHKSTINIKVNVNQASRNPYKRLSYFFTLFHLH